MKKIITLFCVFILSATISIKAQVIVNEGLVWSVSYQGTEGIEIYTVLTTFKGEISIDNKIYKKVFQSKTENPDQWEIEYGYIREEDEKVYLKKNETEQEYLLYDFTLNVGDSYFSKTLQSSLIVDSIVTKNVQGMDLRHFYLSNEDEMLSLLWVEKLGSFGGVVSPEYMNYVGAFVSLLCLKNNGEILFQNTYYCTCYINTISEVQQVQNQQLINVFAHDGMVSILNPLLKGEITFYNLRGAEIFHQIISEDETHICLPQDGIILYRFKTEKGKLQRGKLIVYYSGS